MGGLSLRWYGDVSLVESQLIDLSFGGTRQQTERSDMYITSVGLH